MHSSSMSMPLGGACAAGYFPAPSTAPMVQAAPPAPMWKPQISAPLVPPPLSPQPQRCSPAGLWGGGGETGVRIMAVTDEGLRQSDNMLRRMGAGASWGGGPSSISFALSSTLPPQAPGPGPGSPTSGTVAVAHATSAHQPRRVPREPPAPEPLALGRPAGVVGEQQSPTAIAQQVTRPIPPPQQKAAIAADLQAAAHSSSPSAAAAATCVAPAAAAAAGAHKGPHGGAPGSRAGAAASLPGVRRRPRSGTATDAVSPAPTALAVGGTPGGPIWELCCPSGQPPCGSPPPHGGGSPALGGSGSPPLVIARSSRASHRTSDGAGRGESPVSGRSGSNSPMTSARRGGSAESDSPAHGFRRRSGEGAREPARALRSAGRSSGGGPSSISLGGQGAAAPAPPQSRRAAPPRPLPLAGSSGAGGGGGHGGKSSGGGGGSPPPSSHPPAAQAQPPQRQPSYDELAAENRRLRSDLMEARSELSAYRRLFGDIATFTAAG